MSRFSRHWLQQQSRKKTIHLTALRRSRAASAQEPSVYKSQIAVWLWTPWHLPSKCAEFFFDDGKMLPTYRRRRANEKSPPINKKEGQNPSLNPRRKGSKAFLFRCRPTHGPLDWSQESMAYQTVEGCLPIQLCRAGVKRNELRNMTGKEREIWRDICTERQADRHMRRETCRQTGRHTYR